MQENQGPRYQANPKTGVKAVTEIFAFAR
jgi:hypothetical protein